MSALLLVLTLLCLTATTGKCAGAPTNAPSLDPFDFATPALLTGTVYETGSDHKKILFKFQRTATRSGATVHAERKFTLPNGTVAATESITYDSGQLVSCDMAEKQAALWGKIQINGTPKNPSRQKIIISHGADADPKKAGTTDALDKDTLIDDTVYPFILAHWNDLTNGTAVKFRFVAVEWEKTFGFKMSKTGESTYAGMPVLTLTMEPTSFLVARFMNPLVFTVEKNAPHRVVEYLGRTCPRIKSGKNWKYLDADTVFDWK